MSVLCLSFLICMIVSRFLGCVSEEHLETFQMFQFGEHFATNISNGMKYCKMLSFGCFRQKFKWRGRVKMFFYSIKCFHPKLFYSNIYIQNIFIQMFFPNRTLNIGNAPFSLRRNQIIQQQVTPLYFVRPASYACIIVPQNNT